MPLADTSKESDIPGEPSDIPGERSKILDFVHAKRDTFRSESKIAVMDLIVTPDKSHVRESFDWGSNLEAEGLFVDLRNVYGQIYPTLPSEVIIESKRKQGAIDSHLSYLSILDQVKLEAEQTQLLGGDIEKVEDETDNDFDIVMKVISRAGVSTPEVDPNEDGSINLSWFLKTGGTSTILLYGDDYAIYNTYLEPDNYVRSVCKIRGNSVFPKLIEILADITE